MSSILKDFDLMISALSPTEAKLYTRSANGTYRERDNGKKLYVKDYIRKHFKERFNEKLRERAENDFYNYMKKNDEAFEDMIDEIEDDLEHWAKFGYGDISLRMKYNSPEEIVRNCRKSDDSLVELAEHILIFGTYYPDGYGDLKVYKKFLEKWKEDRREELVKQLGKEALMKMGDLIPEEGRDIYYVYDELFNGKRRIIPPELSFDSSEVEMDEDYRDIKRFNVNFQFFAQKYFEYVHNEEEASKLEESMRDYSRPIPKYYETGKYEFLSKKGRFVKIGKILSAVSSKLPNSETLSWMNRLLSKKTKSKNSKKILTVLSRHPYDIAGMSTDRGWRSCMNLVDGEFRQYVLSSINNGVLIAYLCRDTDTTDIIDSKGKHHKNNKINIQNPLGRCLIKPFVKEGENLDFDRPNFILRCSRTYGTFYDEAVKNLQKWLDYHWNKEIDDENDPYEFVKDAFYFEEEDPENL